MDDLLFLVICLTGVKGYTGVKRGELAKHKAALLGWEGGILRSE